MHRYAQPDQDRQDGAITQFEFGVTYGRHGDLPAVYWWPTDTLIDDRLRMSAAKKSVKITRAAGSMRTFAATDPPCRRRSPATLIQPKPSADETNPAGGADHSCTCPRVSISDCRSTSKSLPRQADGGGHILKSDSGCKGGCGARRLTICACCCAGARDPRLAYSSACRAWRGFGLDDAVGVILMRRKPQSGWPFPALHIADRLDNTGICPERHDQNCGEGHALSYMFTVFGVFACPGDSQQITSVFVSN